MGVRFIGSGCNICVCTYGFSLVFVVYFSRIELPTAHALTSLNLGKGFLGLSYFKEKVAFSRAVNLRQVNMEGNVLI